MDESPGSIVRRFLAAWREPDATELAAFLTAEAIWVDGPQGVRHGATAIADELVSQLAVTDGVAVEVDTLMVDGATVMVEWHGELPVNGHTIGARVAVVFELDDDGRITQMREYYDLQSLVDQITAAMTAGRA